MELRDRTARRGVAAGLAAGVGWAVCRLPHKKRTLYVVGVNVRLCVICESIVRT